MVNGFKLYLFLKEKAVEINSIAFRRELLHFVDNFSDQWSEQKFNYQDRHYCCSDYREGHPPQYFNHIRSSLSAF